MPEPRPCSEPDVSIRFPRPVALRPGDVLQWSPRLTYRKDPGGGLVFDGETYALESVSPGAASVLRSDGSVENLAVGP